jgi:3-methyladenine DNA glycosylase AlkD
MTPLHATLARKKLKALASPEKAKVLSRFFKTGPGEYAEGDQFLGITQPQLRNLAQEFKDLPNTEVITLLSSPIHEERMLALLVWCLQSQKGDATLQKKIALSFLKNHPHLNNWDLIDVAAPNVLGPLVLRKDDQVLKQIHLFSDAGSLWKRRISLLATFPSIKERDFTLSIEFAEKMISAHEDLIHKATGWMLREIGKKDLVPLRAFLEEHAHHMPRTMLRYSIEKLSERERLFWMKQKSARS